MPKAPSYMATVLLYNRVQEKELVDFHVVQADFSGHLKDGQAWLKFFLECLTVD